MIDDCLVVEVAITGDDYPLAEATMAVETTIQAQPPLLRSDNTVLLRFTASEQPADLAAHLDEDNRISYLYVSKRKKEWVFRCLSKQLSTVHELIDSGFLVDTLTYHSGQGIFSGGVIGYDVLRNVLDTAKDTVGVTLRRIYPLDANEENAVNKKWNVTPAQEEALRIALEMNYLSVPRNATADDVADQLGISKSAFLERLHRGEYNLISQMFEGTH